MDEQIIGEKSFSMKLHILANDNYMALNSCILDPDFFLGISHLYPWEVCLHAFTMEYKCFYLIEVKTSGSIY